MTWLIVTDTIMPTPLILTLQSFGIGVHLSLLHTLTYTSKLTMRAG